MKKAFRILALLMVPTLVAALSVMMTACGGGEDDGGGAAAKLLSADPESGATIPKGSTIKLTFDKDPGNLTATGGKVGGSGAARTVTADAAQIVLSWDGGGSATLNYTLAPEDKDPPKLESSSPADGAKDVDPGPVNTDGVVLTFNENVKAVGIDVTDGGTKLGWVASAKEKVITLKPPKGKELVNEKEYVVTGQAEDNAGNKADVKVTFKTKAKQ